jgi:hypothetical protein
MGKRASHPKKMKRYKSAESYRKFRAYIHLRKPSGKMAKSPSQTISAKTPKSHKEPYVKVAGVRRKVEIV